MQKWTSEVQNRGLMHLGMSKTDEFSPQVRGVSPHNRGSRGKFGSFTALPIADCGGYFICDIFAGN